MAVAFSCNGLMHYGPPATALPTKIKITKRNEKVKRETELLLP
jgi:hypothetical protein